MTGDQGKDNRFGMIAVELNFVDQEKLDKALVVQSRIFAKAKVKMPIGQILVEMGAITSAERDEILRMQQELDGHSATGEEPETSPAKGKPARPTKKTGSTIDISVAKDKLTASAYIDGAVPVTEFKVSDVKSMLDSQDILYGIADETQIMAFLNGEIGFGESWTIATGTPPVPDAPPEIKYHFDTRPLKIGTLTEDGLMDWKNRGQLPQVKEGDLLAEKIPGPKGKEGMDVYGKKIPIPKLKEQRFKCGKGARRSEDGLRVHATLSGMPKLSISDEISVMPTLHIQGDISLETGHVEFDGHVEVAGAVEKGYRVKGGSLRADEIRDAQIDIDGDITAMNGIFGATIRCGGNLKAGHIHHSDIILAGDLAVEKEIIESTIDANGRCLINDGIIISSTISAKMGIIAMDIGTKASRSSELIVGIDRQLERELNTIGRKIASTKSESESLSKLLANLKKQSDQINTRLGQVAQEQDKCMVTIRKMKDKVEAGKLKQDSGVAHDLQQAMLELENRQNAYDQDVARLMQEDESISQEIADTEAAIIENTAALQELNTSLDKLKEAQKLNPGKALVKIGGNVFSGTRITGPHSILVLQEDFKRLSIIETDQTDAEGVKRRHFEISPFR